MDSLVLIGGADVIDYPFSLDKCKALSNVGRGWAFLDYVIGQYRLPAISEKVYLLGDVSHKRDIEFYLDNIPESVRGKFVPVYDNRSGSGKAVYDTFYRYGLSDILVVKTNFFADTDYDFSKDEPNTRYETRHLRYGILRLDERVVQYAPDSQTFPLSKMLDIALKFFDIPMDTVVLPHDAIIDYDSIDDINSSKKFFGTRYPKPF